VAAQTAGELPRSILPGPPRYVSGKVLTGLDLLAEQHYAPLKGKRVGLITNQTGIGRNGMRNVDLMRQAGVTIAGLLSPEHGFSGTEDKPRIGNTRDPATGLPVFSLYQDEQRTPSPGLMKRFDLLVFDIQDIGVRFYTYMCTLVNAMRAAAAADVPVLVLDRPNPLTGSIVEGPVLDEEYSSFVGCLPLPLRHGMTIGEIAGFANAELKIGARVDVLRMRGWQREQWFDGTGLIWINPSPNIRSLQAAMLYPGIALLEYSDNYSVGRGTDEPFEQAGAPWIDGVQLAAFLKTREIPGVRFYPVRFRPASGPLAGKDCNGVRFLVDGREKLNAARLGLEVAAAIERLYPGRIDFLRNARLLANRAVIDGLRAGTDPKAILRGDRPRTARFRSLRQQYLLY
jgi:uncharacterized protein YbbC (DUF1343 family)